mgnify:CR=1 FL=1|tara:strand:+ start:1979 stop:3124 length:1146 start_codon:yes stop_codon:yes gene_type:complete
MGYIVKRKHGIRSLRGHSIPRYAIGGETPDPDDAPPMTVTAEGVPIALDAPERGWRRFRPDRLIRNKLGGLAGLGIWEAARDRLARGIENADLGPLRALGILPEGVRESMANVFDERKLTADDLPGNVHDFARMVAAQAISGAPGADLSEGLHVPYPTQGFAAEHFDPKPIDRLVGKILGTNIDAQSMTPDEYNEAFGFMEPSGWGATFGQGHLFEDPEGNIRMIDRYNFPNMTAGQLPNRETGTGFSDYARGLGPHEGEQFREDMAALWGEDKPLGRRGSNIARHYMSEFGSTETDPTEGRSWDINLGPREDLLAAYAAANDPQPSRMKRGLAWLGSLIGRDGETQVAETGNTEVDPLIALRNQLKDTQQPMHPVTPIIQ